MKTSIYDYNPQMQDIKSDILDSILNEVANFDPEKYNENDIKNALNKDNLNIENLKALLSIKAQDFIEEMAQKAKIKTRAHFGNTISLFTPLYLSNFCESKCVYCGFQKGNNINRAILSEEEIKEEIKAIAKNGFKEILLLTGEGRNHANIKYLVKACKIAKEYFNVVGIEVYVMNIDEYNTLHKAGCDYITVYQETYNPQKYDKIHIFGEKRVYPYRINSQERAILGGMRGVGFGALLGIDDFRKDALATLIHAYLLQRKYPHIEISLSAPRLRPILGNKKISPKDVTQARLLQILCAYRLFLPFANITVSSREDAKFRDNIIKILATKISASVSVGIKEHSGDKKGDDQFEISDNRSLQTIIKAIKDANLQPIMSDSVYVE